MKVRKGEVAKNFSIFEPSQVSSSKAFFDGGRDGVSRVNYEVPRLSKLHEDARRCSKDFQQVWYELEMSKVCRDDMPCEVKKNTIWCCWGESWKIHFD